MRDIVRLAYKGPLAQGTLEGLTGPVSVRPPMEFEVPFGGEGLVADVTGIWSRPGVRAHVTFQGRPQIHLMTDSALGVPVIQLREEGVVCPPHVS